MVDASLAETIASLAANQYACPYPKGSYSKGGAWGKGYQPYGYDKGWGKGYGKFGKPYQPPNPFLALGIDPNQPQDLRAASSSLWDACLVLEDDNTLEVAWAKVRLARQQIQRDSGITVETGINVVTLAADKKAHAPGEKMHERLAATLGPETPEQKQERKTKLVQRIVDMLREQPDFTLEATKILNDAEVRNLRVGMFQMFIKWCTHSFPDYFEIERIPGKTQFNVKLADPTVVEVDMSVEMTPQKRQRLW